MMTAAPQSLRERIALHLGWTVAETRGFSFQSLRDLVTDPKIKHELTQEIQSGSYIRG